eukprot:1326362-Pyramimonas_sp.AAC.1
MSCDGAVRPRSACVGILQLTRLSMPLWRVPMHPVGARQEQWLEGASLIEVLLCFDRCPPS